MSLYHTGLPSVPVTITYDPDPDPTTTSPTTTTSTFSTLAGILDKMHRRNLHADEPRNTFPYLSAYVLRVTELLVSGSAEGEGDGFGEAHPELDSLVLLIGIWVRRLEGRRVVVGWMKAEVEDWWVAIEVVNRTLLLYVWTWDERLHLGAKYNEAFYSSEFVREFVDGWRDCLVRELGAE